MLKGENVLLRPIGRSDFVLLTKWLNDPEVIETLAVDMPVTEIAFEKDLEEIGTVRTTTEIWFMIETLAGGRTIGSTRFKKIDHKNRNAEFSIVIGETEYWGRGLGTEAVRLLVNYGFEQLNLHRVSSEVFAFNERSLKMHRKLGFREEGRQREAWFKNGRFHDWVLFAILRDEWDSAIDMITAANIPGPPSLSTQRVQQLEKA